MKISAALSMILLAGPVFAQSVPPVATAPASNAPAPSPRASVGPLANGPSGRAADPAVQQTQVNQRIMQMHQRLKITSAQQPAWDTFAQVMRDNLTLTQQAYKDRREAIASMSAPDNMRNFTQIEQGRLEGIQKLAASFQTLYDGMSDDQKKAADAMFRRYEDRRSAPK